MGEHPHGSRQRYQTNKCRCDECRAANAEYNRRRRRTNTAPATVDPNLIPVEPDFGLTRTDLIAYRGHLS